MPERGLWTKTGNQLVEKLNSFLKDVAAHGQDVTYRVVTTVGGAFDAVLDSMAGATNTPVDTPFPRTALMVPIKKLQQDDTLAEGANSVVVAGGRKFYGVDVSTTVMFRLHTKVPLNFEAVYVIDGDTYKLAKITSSVAIGRLALWNEVMMTRA